ncbi:hypothetical protein [Sinimarinibacterium flocculans]|uniref:hypothetical protein n=1 Tax=Sinimarinibacterium flocculans TaxID=985250 RepID=UPI003517E84C
MKLKIAAAAGLVLGGMSAAQAAQPAYSFRLGLTEGGYQNDSFFTGNGSEQLIGSSSSDDSWFFSYGVQTGFSMALGDFFGDVALEYYAPLVDSGSLDRTDVLATLGYLIGANWSVFAGYRQGMQGDGLMDDETFEESGFYVGFGYGGMQMGPIIVGTSLAYNFSDAEIPDATDEFDYDGISLKVSISPKDAPQHSVQLRYQRFAGDLAFTPIPLGIDSNEDGVEDFLDGFDLTESYLQLTYAYSFYF